MMNHLDQIEGILSFGRYSPNTVQSYKTYTAPFMEQCLGCPGTQNRCRTAARQFISPGKETPSNFLLHVLPKGSQKIRYFGYLNNRSRKNNPILIFNLQGYMLYIRKYKDISPAEIIFRKWRHDITECPHYKAHALLRIFSCRGMRPRPA